MTPGKVWLISIPVFGLLWQFIVVMNIGKSLRKEFARLGISHPDRTPGKIIGMAWCVCSCCILLSLRGGSTALTGFLFLAGLGLWIFYWIAIANYERILETAHAVAPASPLA